MAGQDGTNRDQMVDGGIDGRLQTHTMEETLAGLKECSLFYEVITKAGLHGALGRSGLYTLFAPSNAGIGRDAPDDALQFLERHMLSGAMRSDDLRGLKDVKTVAGISLPVSVQGATVRVGDAEIGRSDIQCTNGVIHVIRGDIADGGNS